MSVNHRVISRLLAALLLLSTTTAVVLANSSASFDLRWNVIGSGGGASDSASYRVDGTIGQSMTGPPSASSASFKLSSGYWVVGSGTRSVYLPVISKN